MMFPGDKLEEQIEEILRIPEDNDHYSARTILTIVPTNEEIVKALSLVESGKLQPYVMVELARTIERSINNEKDRGQNLEERTRALAKLVSYGVIESLQHLKLYLILTPGNHLKA